MRLVNGAPTTDLQMVLGSTAIANLRGKQSVLFKVNESGTEQLLREGVLGRLEGFNIHSSAGVKRASKVAATGYGLQPCVDFLRGLYPRN